MSDVHSYYNILRTTLDNAGFDINDPKQIVVVCGDAFDRGNESLEMFNFLKDMKAQNRLICNVGYG